MALSVRRSMALGKAITDALGGENIPWTKLVLEIEVGHPARVYLKGFVPDGSDTGILQAVLDVTVKDDCTVVVEPLE